MLFNSVDFVIFFVIFLFIYFLLPRKAKLVFLLLASYYFYMCWEPSYAVLILLSTVVDYIAGLFMGRCKEKKKRRKFLFLSLAVNLWMLFFFKYFNFAWETLNAAFSFLGVAMEIPYKNILLPVGISFYTFQTLSYTIEVYNGKIKPTKNFLKFALYVSFFPQLVAGPIERPWHLLAQFDRKIRFEHKKISSGLKQVIWWMFKKLVIADTLALFVDQIYGNVGAFSGPTLILATIFFAFQIYCDFSGYSDIAIGIARMMGYDLMKNFNRPYFSKTISEFWRRWHISLSTWFKDYVYIPLGWNRKKKWRHYLNLFLTFLISWLRHWASWGFVIWGALNGLYLIVELVSKKWRLKFADSVFSWLRRKWQEDLEGRFVFWKLRRFLNVLFTFGLICFAWIFFRANNFADLKYILWNLFKWFGELNISFLSWYTSLVLIWLTLIFSLLIMELAQARHWKIVEWFHRFRWLRFLFFLVLILLMVFFGRLWLEQFIYFQF